MSTMRAKEAIVAALTMMQEAAVAAGHEHSNDTAMLALIRRNVLALSDAHDVELHITVTTGKDDQES